MIDRLVTFHLKKVDERAATKVDKSPKLESADEDMDLDLSEIAHV